jgi:anti-sigma regulatory factor (Ser/Thr protein kinase)
LEEIVTNVICHGCCDGSHASIEVELALQPDELVMTVEDSATPFDPLQAPAPDLEAALEDRPIGGLGVHLVRKLMDRVTYERRDGKNRLVMSKIL